MAPHVAIATCTELPSLDGEGRLLQAALRSRGVTAEPVIWNSDRSWDQYDLVVLRTTWDYFRPDLVSRFLSWTRAIGDRLLNPASVVAWNADKSYLLDLEHAGVPVVATRYLQPGDHIELPAGRCVVKPACSAGVNDAAAYDQAGARQATRHIRALHAAGRAVLLQPYYSRVDTDGETAVIFLDGHASHSVRKGPLLAPGRPVEEGPWREEDITARIAEPDTLELARYVHDLIARRFGQPLYARIDLLRDDHGQPAVLEAELIEPSLFLQFAPGSADTLAAAIARRARPSPARPARAGPRTSTGAHDLQPEPALDLTPGQVLQLRQAAQACTAAYARRGATAFTALARACAWCLPEALASQLSRCRSGGSPAGGLLIRGLPVFDVPATPAGPAQGTGMGLPAAGLLSIIAAVLGEQVGYRAELDGQLIQDIVPVRGSEQRQESVSSDAELYTHVELAFAGDDDRADYIGLLCLRADHDHVAGTTLSPVQAILPLLSDTAIRLLTEARYQTTVDASFLRGLGAREPIRVGPIAVLSGDPARPQLRADFAETSGLDPAAGAALGELRAAAATIATTIRLTAGDLLIVDNRHVFHGRTPFQARWDGADRWLLRTSIVTDLSRSAPHRPRDSHVIDISSDPPGTVPAAQPEEAER